MKLELYPLGNLKPNPQNPKMITEEDVARMAALLEAHGFRDPIEARAEDGLIVAGHRRYLAARKLGLSLVPTLLHDGMTDDEAAAYTIAHTQAEKSGPEWNRALLSDQVAGLPEDLVAGLGFDEAEFARLFDLDRADQEGPEAGEGGVVGPAALIRPGEQWIIGPVTFNVFKGLDNDALNAAQKVIQKIAKMLKCKALLDGKEDQPLEAVLKERADGI